MGQEGGQGEPSIKIGEIFLQRFLGQEGVSGLLGDGRDGETVLGLARLLPLNPQGRVKGDGLVGGDQWGGQRPLLRVGIGSIPVGIEYI